ncbi:unnamed protein product [Protopolystoma xenopodis]|uniref:Uncharacterized protein n=1 Tax=Protopolystoma xenopodis TaxID=117903 RepID=A0A3S5FCZ4_9PLAT|nr:unnamed protein product [Protopolystoma xenopodis]
MPQRHRKTAACNDRHHTVHAPTTGLIAAIDGVLTEMDLSRPGRLRPSPDIARLVITENSHAITGAKSRGNCVGSNSGGSSNRRFNEQALHRERRVKNYLEEDGEGCATSADGAEVQSERGQLIGHSLEPVRSGGDSAPATSLARLERPNFQSVMVSIVTKPNSEAIFF